MAAVLILACLSQLIPQPEESGIDVESRFYHSGRGFVHILESSDRHENISACNALPDGGYVLIGSSRMNVGDEACPFFIVFDGSGEIHFGWLPGHDGRPRSTSVADSGDCFFIITGNALENDLHYSYVTSADESGKVIWTREFPFESIDQVCSTGSGYFLAAETGDHVSFGGDLIVSLNESGEELWAKPFATQGEDFCTSLVSLASGDLVLAGIHTPPDGPLFEGTCIVVRMTPEGDLAWRTDTGLDIHYDCIAAVSQDDVIVAGSGNWRMARMVLTGLSRTGETEWITCIECERYDIFLAGLIFLPDGRFVAAGSMEDTNGMQGNLMLVLFDTQGNPLRGLALDTPGYSFTSTEMVTASPEGGFAIAATASGGDPERFDIVFLGFDDDLNLPESSLEMEELDFEDAGERTWLVSLPGGLL
jgi:hypothetical protein